VPLARQRLLVVEHGPPDLGCCSERGQGAAEGFDREPAVVPDVGQRIEGGIPRHLASAGRAAIVLRDVDVGDRRCMGANGSGRILLFDVRVKRVVVHADVRTREVAHIASGVFGGVEQVDLEAVQKFEAQLDAGGGRVVGHLAGHRDAALPFLGRRAASAELADRRVERAADQESAGGLAAVDHPLAGRHRGLTYRRVRRDRIVVRVPDGDGGPFEAEIIEPLAERGETLGLRVEDRQLDAVETHRLQTPVERKPGLIRRVVRPQQQVHSDFHGVSFGDPGPVSSRVWREPV